MPYPSSVYWSSSAHLQIRLHIVVTLMTSFYLQGNVRGEETDLWVLAERGTSTTGVQGKTAPHGQLPGLFCKAGWKNSTNVYHCTKHLLALVWYHTVFQLWDEFEQFGNQWSHFICQPILLCLFLSSKTTKIYTMSPLQFMCSDVSSAAVTNYLLLHSLNHENECLLN